THRNSHIPGFRRIFDDLQRLLGDLPGNLKVRSRRGAKSEHEFTRIDLRKEFRSKLAAHDDKNQYTDADIRWHDTPSPTNNLLHCAAEYRLKPLKQSGLRAFRVLLTMMLDQPYGDHRYKSARQHVRGYHRKSNRQRQRHEERSDRLG